MYSPKSGQQVDYLTRRKSEIIHARNARENCSQDKHFQQVTSLTRNSVSAVCIEDAKLRFDLLDFNIMSYLFGIHTDSVT